MDSRKKSLLSSNDYRNCIQSGIERFRTAAPLTYAELAKDSQIQTTYLTNVLKGRAHFNADQIFAVTHRLGFSTQEQDYCLLLLEWERTQNLKRRNLLKSRLDLIRNENLKTEDRGKDK